MKAYRFYCVFRKGSRIFHFGFSTGMPRHAFFILSASKEERWTTKPLLQKVKEDGVKFVSYQFTDVTGSVKSLDAPVEQLHECAREWHLV
jgi:hypothetical protein